MLRSNSIVPVHDQDVPVIPLIGKIAPIDLINGLNCEKLNIEQLSGDLGLTEGQSRRLVLGDYESECSEVTDYLYIGGQKVYFSFIK